MLKAEGILVHSCPAVPQWSNINLPAGTLSWESTLQYRTVQQLHCDVKWIYLPVLSAERVHSSTELSSSTHKWCKVNLPAGTLSWESTLQYRTVQLHPQVMYSESTCRYSQLREYTSVQNCPAAPSSDVKWIYLPVLSAERVHSSTELSSSSTVRTKTDLEATLYCCLQTKKRTWLAKLTCDDGISKHKSSRYLYAKYHLYQTWFYRIYIKFFGKCETYRRTQVLTNT